jgi:tRNA(fMet)-specific endonuclease VapC
MTWRKESGIVDLAKSKNGTNSRFSPLIAAERRGHTVRDVLLALKGRYGQEERVGFSTVTLVELVHGIERANTEERRKRRQSFVDELVRDVPTYPLTVEIATLAGHIEGERAARGIVIPFEDLVIGATALHLGFGVVTANVRHFEAIPGLSVVKF